MAKTGESHRRAFASAIMATFLTVSAAQAGIIVALDFKSSGLGGQGKALVYRPDGIPPPAGWPVVYLLHGLGGDQTSWRDLGHIQPTLDSLIGEGTIRPVVVVMPGAGPEGWYVDSLDIGGPGNSETAVVTDLRRAVESSFPVREDYGGRAIAGVSMGGFGALRLALKYPELYVAAASLSGAIWQNVPADELDIDPAAMSLIIDSKYFQQADPTDLTVGVDLPPPPPHFGNAFGNPFDARRFNRQNVFSLLAAALAKGTPLPALYLTVGDDDSHKLWRGAIAFYETMQAFHKPLEFRVTDGDHAWSLWESSVRDVLIFFDSNWLSVRTESLTSEPATMNDIKIKG